MRPVSLPAAIDLATELDRRAVPCSLLVAPRRVDRVVRDWLGERHTGSDAVVLHGADRAAAESLSALGLSSDVVVPPRWWGLPGTVRAARLRGFRVFADAVGMRDLTSGLISRGRVLGFGPGATETEPWWCRGLVLRSGRIARRGGLVRLAVDGTDLLRPARLGALLDAVDLALHHGARPGTYATVPSAGPACSIDDRSTRPRAGAAHR